MNILKDDIAKVLQSAEQVMRSELFKNTREELIDDWHWKWDKSRSVESNTYNFSDALELYKRRCRRWEEHYNGPLCVVERVRDIYLMRRISEFAAAFSAHQSSE